jgi:hypothetical protein
MKDLLEFEKLSIEAAGKLAGGFSAVFESDSTKVNNESNHNRLGGNCKTGCGSAKKAKTHKASPTASNNCGAGKNCNTTCK